MPRFNSKPIRFKPGRNNRKLVVRTQQCQPRLVASPEGQPPSPPFFSNTFNGSFGKTARGVANGKQFSSSVTALTSGFVHLPNFDCGFESQRSNCAMPASCQSSAPQQMPGHRPWHSGRSMLYYSDPASAPRSEIHYSCSGSPLVKLPIGTLQRSSRSSAASRGLFPPNSSRRDCIITSGLFPPTSALQISVTLRKTPIWLGLKNPSNRS